MREALELATATLFADPNLARDVDITPVGSSVQTVAGIVAETEEPFTAFFGAPMQAPALRLLLSRTEVPTEPTEGMTIAIDARTFLVRTTQTDRDETLWDLRCDAVVADFVPPDTSLLPAQLPLLMAPLFA